MNRQKLAELRDRLMTAANSPFGIVTVSVGSVAADMARLIDALLDDGDDPPPNEPRGV